jgi:hypothetical protein
MLFKSLLVMVWLNGVCFSDQHIHLSLALNKIFQISMPYLCISAADHGLFIPHNNIHWYSCEESPDGPEAGCPIPSGSPMPSVNLSKLSQPAGIFL